MADTNVNIIVHGFFTKMALNHETGLHDRAVHWVDYSPRHMALFSRNTHPVLDMKPPKFIKNDDTGEKATMMRSKWSIIGPAYEAWLEGNEIPETGTPLAAWAGCSAEAVEILKQNHIRTLEDFVAATDAQLGRIMLPNARALRNQAKMYIESADKQAAVSKVNDLDEKLAAAMELIAELQANQRKPRKARDEAPVDEDEAA